MNTKQMTNKQIDEEILRQKKRIFNDAIRLAIDLSHLEDNIHSDDDKLLLKSMEGLRPKVIKYLVEEFEELVNNNAIDEVI